MKLGAVAIFLALCACGPAPDSGQRFDLECSGNSGGYSFSDRYSIDLDRRLVSRNLVGVRVSRIGIDHRRDCARRTILGSDGSWRLGFRVEISRW